MWISFAPKEVSNLRGLLYFTDGMGTYPARRPGYDTAFLFLGERFDDANVPPWAMKVVMDEEEFGCGSPPGQRPCGRSGRRMTCTAN